MPKVEINTKFWHFDQNNSGGVIRGPAYHVLVEATDYNHANYRADVELGLYFDGCESGMDCECCGDRWYRLVEDYDNGYEVPSIWRVPVTELDFSKMYRSPRSKYPAIIISYLDGKIETIDWP